MSNSFVPDPGLLFDCFSHSDESGVSLEGERSWPVATYRCFVYPKLPESSSKQTERLLSQHTHTHMHGCRYKASVYIRHKKASEGEGTLIRLFIKFYIFSNVSIIISFYVWITYLLCHCKCFCPWNCICSLVNFTFYSFQFLFSFQFLSLLIPRSKLRVAACGSR